MPQEPLPKAAHPENLTNALRRCGVLKDGRVRSVEAETLLAVDDLGCRELLD